MATELVDFRFSLVDITIVTINHESGKILENIRAKLDKPSPECRLLIDKGRYHQRSRLMTILLLFAVAIIVAVAANAAINPRMPY